MKRSLVLAVAVLLVTSLAALPAAAQNTAEGAITTIGYGQASAPAASANLQFLIMFNYFYGAPPQTAPVAEATPGAEMRETLAPIVAAAEGFDGVTSVEVVVPLIPTYQKDPNILARVDVSVDDPTTERVTSLYVAVSQAALDNRMMVGYVAATTVAADCQALEREARQAALDDARARATTQAELMAVTLGEATAAEDLPISAGPAMTAYGAAPLMPGACDPPQQPSAAMGQLYPGITLPPFDPGTYTGDVEVYRQVRVTFALGA